VNRPEGNKPFRKHKSCDSGHDHLPFYPHHTRRARVPICHIMTDSFPDTHTAPPSWSIAGSLPTLVKHGQDQDHEEVEDYTIKCICGFQEDDGNTVYCERCDTWQHTECYYIDDRGIVPSSEYIQGLDHFCADCQPRRLDTKGAIERQRNRRRGLDPADRKPKKTATKSHKKKIKIPESNESLTNGWSHGSDLDDSHDGMSRSPRDLPPASKKVKTSHRSSHSIALPSNPTSHPHKRSGSLVHSPSKTSNKYAQNGYHKGSYSLEFLQLYDDDPGDGPMHTNLLNDISITQYLSSWSSDVEELRVATNGLSPQDVFNRCEQPIGSMPFPELNKECKEDNNVMSHGRHPRWKYLTIDSFTPKDSVVGELKGKIGHMQNYIKDSSNRWDYLRHPAPFVFFHPKLPIYIDTRAEGTTCRYLRRSCDPNLSMKTFLDGSDYHFCFVAKQDLDAGEELTIGWVLDEHIRKYFFHRNNEDVTPEGDFDEDYVADWVGKVLAEFGGCACSSPNTCALAKYDRRSTSAKKERNGYSGKHTPPDDGYATNSRASSEQADGQSSSGSNSRSRDMTPTRNIHGDSGLGAGLEISDREKRKIAALEKNFEQLENEKHQPGQKKKKRSSGGASHNTLSATTSKQLGHAATSFSQPNTPGLLSKPQYADASTSRRKSGSPTAKTFTPVGRPRSNTANNPKKRPSQPNTPMVPSPLVRQSYVSHAMQTEPDEEDAWYKLPRAPVPPKKPYVSLTKRLLIRSQQERAKMEERRRIFLKSSDGAQTNGHHEAESNTTAPSQGHDDTVMHDAASTRVSPANSSAHSVRPQERKSSPAEQTSTVDIKPPPPWPAVGQSRPVNGYRQNDLRVQMPIKPSISSDSTLNTPLVETPTSAVPQSPFTQNPNPFPPTFSHSSSSLPQPSPIKKKVSLGEYFSRRKGSQPATEMSTSSSPPMHQGAFKPAVSTNGDTKDVAMQDSAIVDTPKKEESDPLAAGENRDSKL
jgi:hypothetical protein